MSGDSYDSYALLKSTKAVLVVAHDTLWRQSFNYKTPFRAAGGVSFCTHDHEIIPQSGAMELHVFAAS